MVPGTGITGIIPKKMGRQASRAAAGSMTDGPDPRNPSELYKGTMQAAGSSEAPRIVKATTTESRHVSTTPFHPIGRPTATKRSTFSQVRRRIVVETPAARAAGEG